MEAMVTYSYVKITKIAIEFVKPFKKGLQLHLIDDS